MNLNTYGVLIVANCDYTKKGLNINDLLSNSNSPILRIINTFNNININNIYIIFPKQLFQQVLLELHQKKDDIQEVSKDSKETIKYEAQINNIKIILHSVNSDTSDNFSLQKIALQKMEKNFDRIFIVNEDRSFFNIETIERLIKSRNIPVSPSNDGISGHPILIQSSIIKRLLKQESHYGLRGALKKAKIKKHYMEVQDEGAITSIDDFTSIDEINKRLNIHAIRPSFQLNLLSQRLFFSPGAAKFLQLISEVGNVKEASERMNLSYSKAWKLINSINRESGKTIIARQQGGISGGSAYLTKEGYDLLNKYNKLNRKCRNVVENLFDEIFFGKESYDDMIIDKSVNQKDTH